MNTLIGLGLGLMVVAMNLLFLAFWERVEKEENERGQILPRIVVKADGELIREKSVFYLKDYAFFRIGDPFFLSLFGFGLAGTLWMVRGFLPSFQTVVLCLYAGFAWTLASHLFWCLESKKKPNSTYQGGRATKVGLVHLPYYYAQYTGGFIGMVVLWGMAFGGTPFTLFAAIGLAGGLGYFPCLAWDVFVKKIY